jgi:hypothetical protein
LQRRHLDESQRAWVAHKVETLRHGQRADQAVSRDADLHLSAKALVIDRKAAAILLNVSGRSPEK